MKTCLLTLILMVSIASCKKDEFKFIPHPGDEVSTPKEIDTVYASFKELVGHIARYHSLREFLEQQNWETAYDRSYSVALPSDTVFQLDRTAGMYWQFFYMSFPGEPEDFGNIIQQVPNGDIGVTFSIVNNTLTLDHLYKYQITDPTLYMDSTYSFLLKQVSITDSLARINVLKLQSHR